MVYNNERNKKQAKEQGGKQYMRTSYTKFY